MTVKQMVDEIHMIHPARPRTQIIMDLNKMNRRFCEQTRVLRQRAALDFVTYRVAEDTATRTSTFTVPANFYKMVDLIESYRAEWEMVAGQLKVQFLSSCNDPINIKYIAYPNTLAADSDTPEMPEQFHDAIVVGVLLDYAARYTDVLQKAGWFRAEYERYKKEAIRWGNEVDATNTSATFTSTGTKTWFSRVSLLQGVNTVLMTGTAFTGATTYVVLINYGEVLVAEYDPNGNLDQRTVSSFKVMAALDCEVDILVTGT